MSESDINLERFAHDVCVHTLEKFGICKAPDDTTKPNKYESRDFLPCVSRSVVSYAICMRDPFKKVLEVKYQTLNQTDNEKMWNFFDGLSMAVSGGGDCFLKVYITLALCTEYIQFMNRKGYSVSLNKVVMFWRDFFFANIRRDFLTKGGFWKLNKILQRSKIDEMNEFHKVFISEYCLPYGAKECTEEMAKECAKNHGISLSDFVPRTDLSCGIEVLFMKMSEERVTLSEASQANPDGREKTTSEESSQETSNSKDSGSSKDTSENTENSRKLGSSESLATLSQNKRLGIPPFEDVLRDIDSFFVENIPSPPKPRSVSKSPKKDTAARDSLLPPSESAEGEGALNENKEQLQEMVEQILWRLEHDMEALKTLLLEQGLITMKSGRRGSRMRIKDADNFPPRGPEGLI